VKIAWLLGLPELKDRVESNDGDAVEEMEGMSLKPLEALGIDGAVIVGENVVVKVKASSCAFVSWTESGSINFGEGIPWPARLRNP
jgi:hypothetical protein